MKLYDSLIKLLSSQLLVNEPIDNELYGDNLRLLKDTLKQCDEFNECDSLEILPHPLIKDLSGKTWSTETIVLNDLIKFKGKCYIYSIGLRPNLTSTESWYKQDVPLITSKYYNLKYLTPQRKIVLPFLSHTDIISDKEKENLRDLLNKILDNPFDYLHKNDLNVTIRGLFEQIDLPEGKVGEARRLKIDIDVNSQSDYFIVYFVSPTANGNEIELKLKYVLIPKEFGNLFKQTFNDRLANEVEVNKFLEDNKIEVK